MAKATTRQTYVRIMAVENGYQLETDFGDYQGGRVRPSGIPIEGRFSFETFDSLSAWLRANLIHGEGVE